jgi:ABC-2 type transport system permease protein
VIGTFAYLIVNTMRNRVQSHARRLKSPRYAIGFLLGIGYFWMVFGRRFNSFGAGAPAPALLDSLATLMSVVIFAVFCGIWIFGGDSTSLAFSEAEVAFLFPAPVPRRALILYKLARGQLPILLNVVVWSAILRRGTGLLPIPFTGAAIWVVFTTLALHRLGGALMRAGTVENIAAKRTRRVIGAAFVLIVMTAVIVGLVVVPLTALHTDASSDPRNLLKAVMTFMQSPGVRTVLFPFHLLVAPVYAPSLAAWAKTMVPALGILGLHLWWVLRADERFEEAAAAASTALAKRIETIRSRRGGALSPEITRAGRRTIALAPTGFPAVAIAWKNVLQFRNVVKPLTLLRLPVLVIGVAAYVGWKTGNLAPAIMGASLVMAFLIPFGVNMSVRSDLRTDMLHLPLLKSLPIAGGDLVLMEVLSSSLPMAALQILFVAIAAGTVLFVPNSLPIPPGALAGGLVAVPIVCLVLCTAYCTILNASAVLFPAWIRLGQPGTGGIEMMGQTILTALANVLAQLLLLIVPAALGGAVWYVLKSYPAVAVGTGLLLGCVALSSECYGIMLALGQAFERAEPQQVT